MPCFHSFANQRSNLTGLTLAGQTQPAAWTSILTDSKVRIRSSEGYAERDAALIMLHQRQQGSSRRISVGADKAYDTADFVAAAREIDVTPYVKKNENGRGSSIDARTTLHAGYAVSLSKRWLMEKPFGWLKQTASLAQVKLRGLPNVAWLFVFGCAAHKLLRLPTLIANELQQSPQPKCA